MKSFALPVFLAVLVFAAALVAAVSEYSYSGSISIGSVALLFAAIAIGVLAQRLYECDKELAGLKKTLTEKSAGACEDKKDDAGN